MDKNILKNIVDRIATRGTGILAADESTPTIAKRLASIDTPNTDENRRAYREILITTPNLEDYVSGIILFEETLGQATKSGTSFVKILQDKKIVVGIKVDKGLIPLEGSEGEKVTQGLDDLKERLAGYKQQGAEFAKWRAVYQISSNTPSLTAIQANAQALAQYAKTCQDLNIVPIVEPEVLIDGNHDIQQCAQATEQVFNAVFIALKEHAIDCSLIILKPSMVIAGKNCLKQNTVEEVAAATLKVFHKEVPTDVPTINFLSGGQTPEQATQHLNALNQGKQPWHLSFSYGRALQEPCLKAWAGNPDNAAKAQKALYKRAKLNHLAVLGEYSNSMESLDA